MEIVKQVFSGQEIRMVERDGEAWMVAADVAKALGYRDAGNMTRILDEDEKGTQIVSTPGGSQEMAIVNEAGIYRAIFASRKEEARQFKRWLAHELLPTLRRTGFYSTREAVVTAQAIARAYGVATRNIPYYMEAHGILPIGHAENPDTGKPVSLYPHADVLEKFMLGSGMREGFQLRAYSGAWDRVPKALAG